jgi:hypothetical protein
LQHKLSNILVAYWYQCLGKLFSRIILPMEREPTNGNFGQCS